MVFAVPSLPVNWTSKGTFSSSHFQEFLFSKRNLRFPWALLRSVQVCVCVWFIDVFFCFKCYHFYLLWYVRGLIFLWCRMWLMNVQGFLKYILLSFYMCRISFLVLSLLFPRIWPSLDLMPVPHQNPFEPVMIPNKVNSLQTWDTSFCLCAYVERNRR